MKTVKINVPTFEPNKIVIEDSLNCCHLRIYDVVGTIIRSYDFASEKEAKKVLEIAKMAYSLGASDFQQFSLDRDEEIRLQLRAP